MVAQSWYTIPSSGVYRSPDGRENYWFYEDDQIPMELAVRMGMDGATLPDPDPYFTADEQAAIAQIASEHAGGGVATHLPTYWNRSYDNSSAGGGVETETGYTIFDWTMVGGLIRVEEAGKQILQIGTWVETPVVGGTIRLSLYGINEGTDAARGLAGTLIGDGGTVDASTEGQKLALVEAPVDPGFYWIMVEPSAEITITGFRSHVAHLGRNPTNGAVYSGMSYNVPGSSMDPHPASINGGSRDEIAPLVLFQIDTA